MNTYDRSKDDQTYVGLTDARHAARLAGDELKVLALSARITEFEAYEAVAKRAKGDIGNYWQVQRAMFERERVKVWKSERVANNKIVAAAKAAATAERRVIREAKHAEVTAAREEATQRRLVSKEAHEARQLERVAARESRQLARVAEPSIVETVNAWQRCMAYARKLPTCEETTAILDLLLKFASERGLV